MPSPFAAAAASLTGPEAADNVLSHECIRISDRVARLTEVGVVLGFTSCKPLLMIISEQFIQEVDSLV